jgi:hypothetical protein
MDPNGRCESFKSREGSAFHANAHNKGDSPHEEIATRLAAVGPLCHGPAPCARPAPGSIDATGHPTLCYTTASWIRRWTWITRLTSLRQSQVEYWAPMASVSTLEAFWTRASQTTGSFAVARSHRPRYPGSVGHQCRRHRYRTLCDSRRPRPWSCNGDPGSTPGDRLLQQRRLNR